MTTDARVRSVLITGTSSGVGRALLQHYVDSGIRVVSVNRRRVEELESRYPSVRFECLDVRSAGDVDRLLRSLAERDELPDVFILNAGINRVDNDASFDLAAYREVLDTNLYGVLNFVGPLTQLPCRQVPRHLVAISSMASYAGNPYELGYHTSKKAVTACFDVWSRMYAGTDLIFQQVLLGPVQTSMYTMADRFPAWMTVVRNVVSAPLESAAREIARFATTRRPALKYPLAALVLFRALALAQRLVPRFFQGRTTIDGNARRP
jgi:NAD(P)-dependent dehydrogenase (short-subunit alcohol dehydrogenase family)